MEYTKSEISIIREHYPTKGSEFVANLLNRTPHNIRNKASSLKIKFDNNSEFFREFHNKSNKARLGIKKPDLSIRLKERFRNGELKMPSSPKHNLSKDRCYRIWNSMMTRCFNEKHKSYKDYGGRGIKVCELWKDITKFKEWFDRYFIENYSIDRLNVNGDYEPSNCRFSTNYEQMRNRRNTKINNFIVRIIKKMHQENISQPTIAKVFNMNKMTVNNLILGKRWGNINN